MRKYLRMLLSAAVLFQYATCTANQYGSYGTVSVSGSAVGANFTWNNATGGGGRTGIPAYGQPFQTSGGPVGYPYGANP